MLNEETGMAFLDEYEARGGAGSWDQDIDLGDKLIDLDGYERTSNIPRLREGIERSTTHRISDSAASYYARQCIPVLWEMPSLSENPGGWVLYMGGHTEWRPYPGKFPMTPAFMTRLNALMRPTPEYAAARERMLAAGNQGAAASPVYELTTSVLDCLWVTNYGRSWSDPYRGWWFGHGLHMAIVQCDQKPSVLVDGLQGYRVVLRKTEYEYSDEPYTAVGLLCEKLRFRASGVPGVLPRHSHVDFVLLPATLENPEAVKRRISWPRLDHEEPFPIVHMGKGHGYHWFGRMTAQQHFDVHERLDLEVSPDFLEFMKNCLSEAPDRSSRREVYRMLSRAGERAVPVLQKEIEQDVENCDIAAYALERAGGTKVTHYLLDLYRTGDETRSRAAAKAILRAPRREAKEVYLAFLNDSESRSNPSAMCGVANAVIQFGWEETKEKWLGMLRRQEGLNDDASAYIGDMAQMVSLPLHAPGRVAAHFGWQEAIPLLDAYGRAADSMATYRLAYELRGAVEGRPVPEALEEHERIIRDMTWRRPYSLRSTPEQVEAAKQALIACPDEEAVALVAISLATTNAGGKGRPRVDPRLAADGFEIARTLPREAMAYHLRRLSGLERVGLPELNQEFLADPREDAPPHAEPGEKAPRRTFAPYD